MCMIAKRIQRNILSILLYSLVFVCLGISYGSCSQNLQNEETVTVLKKDWIALQENTKMLYQALDESQRALSEAKLALEESNLALSEARNLSEVSQMTLNESQEKLLELMNESAMQKAEIERLKAELATQKKASYEAYEAISKANKFLEDTREEIKKNEEAHARVESRLRTQRNIWEGIAFIATGFAVSKCG